jgi:hypothetical protein
MVKRTLIFLKKFTLESVEDWKEGKIRLGLGRREARKFKSVDPTMAYAGAKKRYLSEFRSAMPILIAIGLKQKPETSEVEEFRSAFRQFVASALHRTNPEGTKCRCGQMGREHPGGSSTSVRVCADNLWGAGGNSPAS